MCSFEWSDPDDSVESFDHMMHKSLDQLFRERCLSSGVQIKDFLRGLQRDTDQSSIIKRQILEKEAVLSKHFSKEELAKFSLLWIAVLGGYRNSAELLVRSGADVNKPFGPRNPQVIDSRQTILHVLLKMHPSPENERLVRLFVDHGADLQARDAMGRTALHFPATKGLVEMLLERGADLKARDFKKQTPLHIAAKNGRVQVMEMLLEKGANANVVDKNGWTPLHLAAATTKADELLPLLVKHGADVYAKDEFGRNVLHSLTTGPMQRAADLARVFIEKGVSVNDRNSHISQYQPIHLAVLNGKNELVNLFLDHGANVNSLAYKDISPLYLAVKNFKTPAVLETLLMRGADVYQKRAICESTALHAACEKHDLDEESIRLLLLSGADVLAEDWDGDTPLALIKEHNMSKSGTCLIVKKLALIKVCQPSVELKDETLIKRYPKLFDYYRDCTEQIERMKSTSFIKRCTFFNLLTKCHCRIAALMRNPEFEINFKNFDLSEFSTHAEDIRRAFERARVHYDSLLEQENVISEAVYDTLPYVVVRRVVHYICNCCENLK